MGSHIFKQCPNVKCRHLTIGNPHISSDQKRIDIVCSACNISRSFYFPENWKWVQGHDIKNSERGAWIESVEHSVQSNKDQDMH